MLEIKKIFSQIMSLNVWDIKKIETGYTNENYLINKMYVLRLPKHNNEQFINYELENEVLQIVANLNINETILYFDTKTGIKVSKYLNDAKTFDNSFEEILEVASVLKRLHNCNYKTNHHFNGLNKLHTFKSDGSSLLEQENKVVAAYAKLYDKYPSILCHNDVVKGNILFQNKKCYLIDYEYASDNIALFDIISFIGENNLDQERAELFIKHYYTEINSELINDMEVMLLFQDLLWYNWANMMYNRWQENIYYSIAQEKLKRYLLNVGVWKL